VTFLAAAQITDVPDHSVSRDVNQMGSPPRRRSTSMLPRVALEYGQT
jgi:hypothetical protein